MKATTKKTWRHIDGRWYIDARDMINALKILEYKVLADEMDEEYQDAVKKAKEMYGVET